MAKAVPNNLAAFLSGFNIFASMNRVLVIEDEKALLESMVDYLQQLGYEVNAAANYSSALAELDHFAYDCLVVDLNLPDGDGIQIIKMARENNSSSGIIIVSARETLEQRIAGLDAGADDYLVKPFHLAELGARVQSIIRRVRYEGDTSIRLGKLTVFPEDKVASFEDEKVELTPKELNILTYLISNKDRVISKESLSEHIWGDEVYQIGSFDPMYTHIKNLRKKIHNLTGEDWLKTVYGVGYKLSHQS